MEIEFKNKYLKYKNKYNDLKNMIGGSHVNEEVFIKVGDTIKQGIIKEDISPNYIVEIEENGKKEVKTVSKVAKDSEYKLVSITSNVDLISNINYFTDKFVVYYHGSNCNDGITSAWITNKYLTSKGVNIDKIKYIDLHASKEVHEKFNKFNDVNSIILFVDIAPSLITYNRLKENNKRIIVIDHHITNLITYYPLLRLGANIIFDMNTSGAGLTWKTFFKKEAMPPFIELVVKRDIFRQVEGDNTDSFYEIYNELLWSNPPPKNKQEMKELSIYMASKFDDIQMRINRKELPENFFELETVKLSSAGGGSTAGGGGSGRSKDGGGE